MIHFVRANVRGQGYTSLDSRAGGASLPLPTCVLRARQRLDDFLEGAGEPVAVTFNNDGETGALVGYACRVDARDEFDRRGLIFLHAVLLDDERDLPRALGAMLGLLAPAGIAWITRQCEALARGEAAPGELVDLLERRFVRAFERLEGCARPPRGRAARAGAVGAIEHDCAGGSAVAWLYLARQQAGARPPWEVFDTRTAESARLTTVVGGGLETRRLTELLLGLLEPDQVAVREAPPAPVPVAEREPPQLRLPTPVDPAPRRAPSAEVAERSDGDAAAEGPPLSAHDHRLLLELLALLPDELIEKLLQSDLAWWIKVRHGGHLLEALERLKMLPIPRDERLRRGRADLVGALQAVLDEIDGASFGSAVQWVFTGSEGPELAHPEANENSSARLRRLVENLAARRSELAAREPAASGPQGPGRAAGPRLW